MNAVKMPEVPIWERSEPKKETVTVVSNSDTGDGRDFVPRTLRVTAIVVLGCLWLLAQKKGNTLIIPFLVGSALGAVLLAGFEFMVRRTFAAETILAQKRALAGGTENVPKKFGGKAAILLFALIKYPAVALLIWWIVRSWSQMQIIAFASGFGLLQLIIGLRGLGAFLFPQTTRK